MTTNAKALSPSAAKTGPTHGGGIRGADLPRRSVQFEGVFGRMFRTLPAADFADEDLVKLAKEGMTAEAEAEKNPDGTFKKNAAGFVIPTPTPEGQIDDEENFGL